MDNKTDEIDFFELNFLSNDKNQSFTKEMSKEIIIDEPKSSQFKIV